MGVEDGYISFQKDSYMAAKVPSKSEILASVAATTELSRKQVAAVFRCPVRT